MSRSLTTICLVGLAALMLAACSQPRKAVERRCNRADRHLARAVWLCPDILTRDSAQVTIAIAPDSAASTTAWRTPEVDSLLNACADFALSVVQRNDSLRALLLAGGRQGVAGIKGPAPGLGPPAAAGLRAQERLREQLCQFDAFEAETELCYARVRPGKDGPLLTLEQKAYHRTATAPCPPQLQRPPCPSCPDGVATWWRTVALILMAALVITNLKRIIGLFVSVGAWGKMPGG